MAFQNKNLSVIVCTNGFTMWHYVSSDVLEDVLDGYFNPVADLMNANDMIILNLGDQNCIIFVKSIENKSVKLG